MSRTRFETIRANVRLHAPSSCTEGYKPMDPLWHTRVPVGAASLNENTVRTKARSSARTYLPSKPDKYGVRFYAVVGWGSLYGHSVFDNGSGNTQASPPAELYCSLFSSYEDLWLAC
ncbi:hypothetical protein JG687_00004926 [Phytophthora cactorum]|uniref:Uncharacterized protein n=1 Tax=Phytophthora cactorum TaxID=29920 RepID=A0A8T1UPP2_9STRA|nr:hypothetical protein JG687_00004926 [Phytophthora cactorum]